MMHGRVGLVVVLIVSLVAAAVARDLAQNRRHVAVYSQQPVGESRAGLTGMDSFALALMLGGMRGPLVMFLWTSSEAQKTERELDDFDTKVEWIRLLQPEFDSVHLFQIWNKAYNISVQMASLANKYTTIIDAIDYAQNVNAQRPGNINVLAAMAQVYFDKLGNAQEKYYYRQRVRDETQHRPTPARENPRRGAEIQVIRLNPMLDPEGRILSQYLQPSRPRPADLPPEAEWYDGSELQFLAQFEPFPYGISTFALGYNYYKQAQILQSVDQQVHIQLSRMVIDSRPALALKNWTNDEFERGRQAELQAFDWPLPHPLDHASVMERPTAGLPLDASPANPQFIEEALYSYQRAVQVSHEADREYRRHTSDPEFARSVQIYRSHLDQLHATRELALADYAYLRAMQAGEEQRDAYAADARRHYREALHAYQLIILQYYVDEDILDQAAPGHTRLSIAEIPAEQRGQVLQATRQIIDFERRGVDRHGMDREEFDRYIYRAQARLNQLS